MYLNRATNEQALEVIKLIESKQQDILPSIRTVFKDKKNFPLFCKVILHKQFNREFRDVHYDIMRLLLQDRNVELQASRGLGKTIMGVFANTIWRTCNEMNKYLIINSYDSKLSMQKVEAIKQEFEVNKLIQFIYGNPQTDPSNWNKGKVRAFSTTIESLSTKQNPRGAADRGNRPDFVISDDIMDSEAVRSEEQREKAIEWYKESLMPIVGVGGKFLLIGTPMHKDDVICTVERKIPPFNKWSVGKFPAMIDGKSVDEGWKTTEELNELMMDEYTFSQEYMLNPIQISSGMVSPTQVNYWREGELPQMTQVAMHIDTTHTANQTSDYYCICFMGKGVDNRYYVIDFKLEKADDHTQAKALIDMYKLQTNRGYTIDKVTYDEKSHNGFGYWATDLARRDYNMSLPLTPLKYNKDKVSHFRPYYHHFVAGNVYLPQEIANKTLAENQLFAFPQKGVHDDFVDGLSGCFDHLKFEETDIYHNQIGDSEHSVGAVVL